MFFIKKNISTSVFIPVRNSIVGTLCWFFHREVIQLENSRSTEQNKKLQLTISGSSTTMVTTASRKQNFVRFAFPVVFPSCFVIFSSAIVLAYWLSLSTGDICLTTTDFFASLNLYKQ